MAKLLSFSNHESNGHIILIILAIIGILFKTIYISHHNKKVKSYDMDEKIIFLCSIRSMPQNQHKPYNLNIGINKVDRCIDLLRKDYK